MEGITWQWYVSGALVVIGFPVMLAYLILCWLDWRRRAFCDCGLKTYTEYGFVDWVDDRNDVFGDIELCRSAFQQAIKRNSQGVYVVYEHRYCEDCGGVEVNKALSHNMEQVRQAKQEDD